MSQQNGQSVQSDVLDAVVAQLGGNVAGAYRCRFSDFAQAQLPADNVIPDDEDTDYTDSASNELKSRFVIKHFVSAPPNTDGAELAADARYVAQAKKLFLDPTLGGTVRSLKFVGRKWERDRGEVETVILAATYEVEYSTNRYDPSLPSY